MKRILAALAATVGGVALLFSYRTSLAAVMPSAPAEGAAAGASSSNPVASGSSSSAGLADGSYTGEAVQTRWGPVQVRITVSGGRITGAEAIEYPTSNGRDQQINAYAVPILQSETLDAQSAEIDMVSGATVTSTGYLTSLQSALDQAAS